MRECPMCRGTGVLMDEGDCPDCAGKGLIPEENDPEYWEPWYPPPENEDE